MLHLVWKGALTMQDTASTQFSQWEQAWTHEFEALYQQVAGAFARAEPRQQVRHYLQGLLGRLDRKNSWHLAELLQQTGPPRMQRLLNGAHWDADVVRDVLRAYVLDHLGAPDGVLILDEPGFLKKGRPPAGVARQYSDPGCKMPARGPEGGG